MNKHLLAEHTMYIHNITHFYSYLLVCIELVDVLDGCGDQFRGEFRRHANGQRHSAFQRRVGDRAVVVIVIVVPDLKGDTI